jgi:hypothetical protein
MSRWSVLERKGGDLPMPFKSQAQRRKFAQLLVEGKISDQTFEEWNRETGGKKLPERVGSRSKVSIKPTSARKRRTAKKK